MDFRSELCGMFSINLTFVDDIVLNRFESGVFRFVKFIMMSLFKYQSCCYCCDVIENELFIAALNQEVTPFLCIFKTHFHSD